MSDRIQKINDLVRDHVSEIITKELSLKQGVFASIIKVDTSKDLRYARLFVSVFPNQEADYVMKTLEKETPRMQGMIGKRLKTKIVPKLRFSHDETQERASEIEDLFEKIKKEDQES